jgi:hypothetical protein
VALNELYSLNGEASDLAVELMQYWALDRYYVARINLCHAVLREIPEVVQKS